MALLWCDGFDHYGLDETKMLDGAWANVQGPNGTANATLSTTQAATGTHSFRFHQDVDGGTPDIRKVLDTNVDKIGAAFRVYFDQVPDDNVSACLVDFLTSTAGRSNIQFILDSNGAIQVARGKRYDFTDDAGTVIATSDSNLITAGAWTHVEIQAYIHDTLGWVRVAINGVNRFEASGLDTKYSGNVYSVGHGNIGNPGADWYIDDVYYYDFNGDSGVDTDFCPTVDGSGVATSFIGELQVIYLPVNGDTAEDDWVPSTGTDAYAMVDETTPDDADYISSTAAGDLSEFEIQDLPEDITYIRGVQFIGRLSKSDAGSATTQFGVKSVADVDDAAARPVTVAPTYWWDFINVDPDSGSRWTKESLDAAWFRLTRAS